MRQALLVAVVVSGCSFAPGVLPSPTDAMTDGPPPVTVGFAKATDLTDENAGTISVRVILSQPADEPITVSFAATGGTASRPADYLLTDGVLTFAPGDVEETIPVTLGPDGDEEPDETIEITLSAPSGAGAALAIATHTLTISANVLPRVTFELPTSNAAESASPTVNVVLDVASQVTTSIEIAVIAGSATGGGTDYTLATTSVAFNPMETSKPVTLSVVQDLLDEANENVMLELQNPINLIVGATSTREHVINDDDDAPTVSFAVASASIRENGGTRDIAVSLSAVSGKNVNVPFSISNTSTATGGGTDYTLVTPSPLQFTAGTQTLNIQVTINDDAVIESDETIVIVLGNPTPGPNATLVAPTTHILTIHDNDSSCLGTGTYALCFTTPAQSAAISGTLDTDTSPLCATAAPLSGWAGGPDSCFVVATDIAVAATVVTGSRPLVLFATGDISVTGNLDAASHRGGTSGPGANIGCGMYTDDPDDSTSGAGGGAGGTFRTAGGNGGQGNDAAGSGGSALAAAASAPTTLRGGCVGQKGGDGFGGTGSTGGVPGNGGGALYLVAAGAISVTSGITINVSGGGGDAVTTPDNGLFGGGGGGGSGGMLKLHAASFAVTGARFMANGGGGSSGADENTPGVDGFDPSLTAPTEGGVAGSGGGAGANGGRGFGTTTATGVGSNGTSNNGGGGGGGGGGYISSNLALTGATAISAGQIEP